MIELTLPPARTDRILGVACDPFDGLAHEAPAPWRAAGVCRVPWTLRRVAGDHAPRWTPTRPSRTDWSVRVRDPTKQQHGPAPPCRQLAADPTEGRRSVDPRTPQRPEDNPRAVQEHGKPRRSAHALRPAAACRWRWPASSRKMNAWPGS